jgi:hypothetical protein
VEPDPLGQPADDQGDLRPAARLPLPLPGRQLKLKPAVVVVAAAALVLAASAAAARVHGTRHGDLIQTVNGKRDFVFCGRGRDLATVDGLDRVARDCEVVTRQISSDPYRTTAGQHATQVEPDTASWGSTVVAVFQSDRFSGGGSANIGFAVSRNAGRTWKHGFLPGTTVWSKPKGTWPRVSDPTVAYDSAHHVWLAVSLAFSDSASAFLVSRSADGLHWQLPVTTNLRQGFVLDKQWIACDNGASSPFHGRCYLSYDDLGSTEIETQVSADGGAAWSAPAAAPGFPGRAAIQGPAAPGVQPVVRPDGMVVIPYFDETHMAAIRSLDGGTTWLPATPIAPVNFRGHPGLRVSPMPSAEVDGSGAIYLAWADCSSRKGCLANDLHVARSANGLTWDAPITVPTHAGDVELPGIAADFTASGRIAVAYYTLSGSKLNVSFVASRNRGQTWTKPQRLNSRPVDISWIASAGGAMVGDYISTSFAGGRAVPVFALALRPRGGSLRESMFSSSLATPH